MKLDICSRRLNLLAALLLILSAVLLTACGDNTATPAPAATTAVASSTTSAAAGTTTASLSTGTEKPSPLRIGLIPNQNPETVKAQYASFKTYMEKTLGIPVELFVGSDYPAVVQAMVTDKLDMAYFGGLTYLQAREQADVYPIVTEIDRYTNNRTYTSAIIVPADSPVQKVEDLKGKIFAFGDVASTSGSLYPRIMLDQAGIKVPGDLKEVKYTGGHDATALAVQNGSVDAGGLEERILLRLEDQGKVDKNKIRVIKRSDPIMGYPWVVRAKLDKDYVEKITNAFLNIKDPTLLQLLRAEGYARVSADDYTYAREQAIRLGLLVPKK
ncbi:MAG TPA: phosphate/phosphite/phosphonate ABC transporter substrate-binding protein [Chloroflexia bacterium]|nr:phosphate/phosphite/phosphonate ABC transporter substrate-binding protein [Chloroflexia bacterium]